jgi:pimeloyl-ACP methyl ester carboxylesterase
MSESGIAKSADGTGLAWSRTGSGPVLVMVDPILLDRALSPNNVLAERLIDRFTVVRYDRRGKGDSISNDVHSPDREIEDLQAVIDAVGSGPETIVYGLSSGGSLALYAASRGVRMKRLIVLEPPSGLSGTKEFISETEELIGAGRSVEAVQRFYQYQGMPADIVEQMAPFAQACAPYAPTMANDLRIADELTPGTLSGVAVPTIAIVSKASPPLLHAFVDRIAAHVATAESVELEGDWHGVSNELLAQEIAEFVSSSRPATPL